MILFIITTIMLLLILVVGISIVSIGGTIFTIIGADIIVAGFILWFLFFRKKKK